MCDAVSLARPPSAQRPVWMLVTLKLASSFTVTCEPSALAMWASYVAPSASVSTRRIVPPGTAASAAASAFVAVSPVRSASVIPLAT